MKWVEIYYVEYGLGSYDTGWMTQIEQTIYLMHVYAPDWDNAEMQEPGVISIEMVKANSLEKKQCVYRMYCQSARFKHHKSEIDLQVESIQYMSESEFLSMLMEQQL